MKRTYSTMTVDEAAALDKSSGKPAASTSDSQDSLDRAEKRKKKHYAKQKEKRRQQRAQSEQSSTGGSHDPSPPAEDKLPRGLFEQGISHIGGIGLFALRRLCAGTLLITEKPLLSLAKAAPPPVVISAARALSPHKQSQYLNLSYTTTSPCGCPGSHPKPIPSYDECLVAIWKVNTFDCPKSTQAVYATCSRVNHSCTPNIMFSHKSDNATLVAHAVRDIEIGEELTWSYVDVFQGVAARHHCLVRSCPELRECNCETCREDTPLQTYRKQESDDNRTRIADLRAYLGAFKVDHATVRRREDVVRMTLQLEKLLKEEGLIGIELAKCYALLAMLRSKTSGPEMGLVYKKKEVQILKTCLGADSPKVISCEAELQRMESGRVPVFSSFSY